MDDNTHLKPLQKQQMIVKIIKPYQNNLIKIIEPFKSDVLLFETPEDFTEYYRTHEDEFKNISTVLLNRKYKITGYRITQNKTTKELSLRKDYYGGSKAAPTQCDENRLTKIENEITELRNEINNIIKYLQSNS